jgi:nickel-type superoxide dismutase maturation protease
MRIANASMLPTLSHGQIVLVDRRRYAHHAPRPGEVVVLLHPNRELILVKRVVRSDESGVWVEGDNPPESEDSRHFGAVPRSACLARVECILL